MKIARLFEWVLVLWICYGDGVAIDHIDGFVTNGKCSQAGAKVSQDGKFRWVCVEK